MDLISQGRGAMFRIAFEARQTCQNYVCLCFHAVRPAAAANISSWILSLLSVGSGWAVASLNFQN